MLIATMKALLILAHIFSAVFATVVVSSPSVNGACWSSNPCQYSDKLPVACRDNGSGN